MPSRPLYEPNLLVSGHPGDPQNGDFAREVVHFLTFVFFFEDGEDKRKHGPKMAQDWPKKAQDGPKMAPRWAQDGPRWAQDGPKMGLKSLLEAYPI